MVFGSAFHALVESRAAFEGQFAQAPDCRRGTNEWKAAEAKHAGKRLLKIEQIKRLEDMLAVFLGHRWLRRAVLEGINPPVSEETFYWFRDGHLCKCRADLFVSEFAIIDIKVTHDARRDAFERTIRSFDYHRRAAWYVDGVHAVTGDVLPYVFVCIESTDPHAIGVYAADDQMVSLGRMENNILFDRLVECRSTGIWPGYADEVEEIGLSRFHAQEIASRIGAEVTL